MRGLIVFFLLVSWIAPAHAEDKALARKLYSEGQRYYDLNQFPEALDAFRKAYWNYEEPSFLFNIAQCYRALGEKEQAVKFYRSYLRKDTGAANREEVKKIVDSLEAMIAKERETAMSPPQGTIGPGERPAKPQKSGEPTPEPVQPQATEPKPQPAPPANAQPTNLQLTATPIRPTPAYKRWWVWTLVGVAAAGAAAGIAVGVTQGGRSETSLGVVHY
jgi:hypothetical protein